MSSLYYLLFSLGVYNNSLSYDTNFIQHSLNNKCENEVVVAIIDTGIDFEHDYLKSNFYINKNEKLDGVDSDKNGFIGDLSGWNFLDKNNTPDDKYGHGTHIAGLVVGFNKDYNKCIKIMNLKFYEQDNKYNFVRLIDSINYAIDNNANIINISGGGKYYIEQEFDAIQKGQHKNVLFVTAAGNDNLNNKQTPYYPASYNLDNIISVAAYSFEYNNFQYSSNYGDNVHVLANGSAVSSTLPNNKYGHMTGTSQATAVVSNRAANLWLKYKNYDKVKEELFKLAKPYKTTKKYVKYGLIE